MFLFIIFFGIVHFSYNIINNFVKNELKLTMIYFILFYHFNYWFFGLIFESFDKMERYKDIKKKFKIKTTEILPILKVLPVVFKNQFLQSLVFILILPYFIRDDYNHSLISSIFWLAIYYIIFDVVFYFGHYGMHKNKFIKNLFDHTLHHETFGTQGITGSYMSFMDFILESVLQLVIIVMTFKIGGIQKIII
jgi:sterol desaturase/sphingolipid hydroxylase (fatty acid hydroxylase superfamily)